MRERIENTLMELIKFKSTANNIKELKGVVDYVEDNLRLTGLTLRRFEKNYKPSLLVTTRDTLNPKILFVGHLDVVDAKDEDFVPRLEGNRIYGRGSIDMKGSCAVMMELAKELAAEKYRGDVGFLFTTDEEVGSKDGVQYLVEDVGVGGEFVIIPDGGHGFQLIVEGKGVLHLKIVAKGRSVHGSRVFEGENALDKLFNIYNELLTRFPKEPCGDPEHWHNTINLGKVVGGDSVNRVPDYAEMYLDIRFVPPYKVSDIESMVKETISKYPRVDYEVLSSGEPVFTDRNSPFILRFKKIAEEVLKRKVNFAREHGATDGRFFSVKGMQVLITAPYGENVHGDNEWVDVVSLVQLFEIFRRFVQKEQ